MATDTNADKPVEQAETGALVLSDEEIEYFREVSGGDAELNTAAPTDFYQLLSIDYDADAPAIRAAYRSLQRIAHPDIAGDCAHELAVLLNCAYATLSNLKTKEEYDAGLRQFRADHMDYDGLPVSQWFGPPGEQRAVFVDETQCIGCTQCTSICPSTFFMEDDYGRARVSQQWADEADAITEAMDLCPVDSIHYVRRDQLALLEFVMRGCKREDAAILARRRSGNMAQAPNSGSPFERAATFLRHRKEARPAKREGTMALHHDQDLAASISRAWIALPTAFFARQKAASLSARLSAADWRTFDTQLPLETP
ncbi:hypothetical protein WJX73_004791 [Symbiochloris irregularis]|uniref:Uncharacterized protein n=1 Tax=Symbiochloris irregularis TaxID=706552 RepID=A0AAW1NTY7_9CHLO